MTVAVISYNRVHYLRATLESAHRCIHYPRVQWIVVDASVEAGLRDYLYSLDWIDDLILQDSHATHIDAMNEAVSRARGDVVLIWPDDMQFIVEGDWMADCVEILMAYRWIGSMALNCLRRVTVRALWSWRRLLRWREWARELRQYGTSFRRQRTVCSSRGFAVRTCGWTKPGIVGSGIPSLTRTEVWRTLGPWKTSNTTSRLEDSSRGGEEEMLARWASSRLVLQRAQPILPVAADIVTDPTGSKAKVRGGKRYGFYMSAPEGTFYYQIYRQADVQRLSSRRVPVAFEEFVKPLGYSLPLDSEGNLLKDSFNPHIVSSVQ